MYRRLLRFLRPHRWRMAATVGCNVVAAVLDGFSFTLLIPFLNALFDLAPLPAAGGESEVTRLLAATVGRLLDPADKMGSLQVVVLFILGTIALKNAFVWLAGQLGAGLQEVVTRDLRNAVYLHLGRLPLAYFQRTKAGQILARVLSDTTQTKQVVTQLVTTSLQSSAVVLTYVVLLVLISWKLTLLALVVAPVLIGLLQPLLRKLRKGYRRLSNQYGEITNVVQETVGGIRLVKAFGAEAYEGRRFLEASARYARDMTRVTRISLLAQPITEVVGTMIAVGILWVGARQVLFEGTLSGSQLVAFLVLVMRLLQPLKQLSQIQTTAQQSLAAAERLFDVLDSPTEPQLDRGRVAVADFREAIVFDHVGFSYGGEPVLQDISFTAPRGEVVALVGASGAGKSTLVDLIPRFYEPTGGRILLDGVDTRDITLPSLRRLMGIVSQDTVLFNDTVRNNIAYGAEGKYSPAQIEAAARAANAHGFITELPDGYDTQLGERGTRLSGGQRQRIAIARALLVDPPILILDEATSALDTESERLVQEAIDRLLAGRTVFVIAHRLSTVEHADQILVLDAGRIAERGRHTELIELRGAYWRLYSMQFRDAASEERESEVPA